MSILEVKNLCYTYAKNSAISRAAVKDINFSAEVGEIIGVIGHTGSGKSTLMQALNGLIKPDSGEVIFNGTNIWENEKEIYKIRFEIGLVFQYPEYQLFEETVYKDIAFGPKNMGLSDVEIDFRVKEAAYSLGLTNEHLEKSPFDLSGGEKRRAAIAGVLAMRPKILVLDEPTAGLDPEGRELLLNTIISYKNKEKATVIIVSHSMEDMAKITDKLLVLNNGEVALFDTTDNVFQNTNKLIEMGLDVPLITRIAIKLKQCGLIKNDNIFTVDDAVNIISSTIKGGIVND